MATEIVNIKSDLPLPPQPPKLGRHSVQMRCPHCNTRVLTIVRHRLCGFLPPVHECPQCHRQITLSVKKS